MSTIITIEEAQAHLPELIAQLQPGEELLIQSHEQTIAKLVGSPHPRLKPRKPGSAVGKLVILAEDDEHLADFREYMP